MFGGYGFLMNGHMCVFIQVDRLVIRIGEAAANAIANQPHVGPMDLTDRRMRVGPPISHEGVTKDAALQRYVDYGNPVLCDIATKGGQTKSEGITQDNAQTELRALFEVKPTHAGNRPHHVLIANGKGQNGNGNQHQHRPNKPIQ